MTLSQSVCEVLRAHVVLESESVDRMCLQCRWRHCRHCIGVGNGLRRPLPPNPVCGFPATGSPVSCFRIGIGAPIDEPRTS
jgi:hypothetical protein